MPKKKLSVEELASNAREVVKYSVDDMESILGWYYRSHRRHNIKEAFRLAYCVNCCSSLVVYGETDSIELLFSKTNFSEGI